MKVLITNNQGVGDEILYAAGLRHFANDQVTLQASLTLWPLFKRNFPGVELVKRDKATTGEGFDVKLENCELPIAKTLAYLTPKNPFARYTAGFKEIVGLSWYSHNPHFGPAKSARLETFAPLASRWLVSLQYGDTTIERRRCGFPIFHDPEIDPLTDMEAFVHQVASCDIVVTTSNTTMHVAGALGRRTFVLVPGDYPQPPWYWNDMPYTSVTVCKGEGEQWASQALSQALRAL